MDKERDKPSLLFSIPTPYAKLPGSCGRNSDADVSRCNKRYGEGYQHEASSRHHPISQIAYSKLTTEDDSNRQKIHATAAIAGAGELAAGLEGAFPLLLTSLPLGLLLPLIWFSSFEIGVPVESLPSRAVLFGVRQDGRSHMTPVKLLTEKPFFSHLRHGFPDLSRARRPALMAPWLALGPSLCPLSGAGVVHGLLVPSGATPFSL